MYVQADNRGWTYIFTYVQPYGFIGSLDICMSNLCFELGHMYVQPMFLDIHRSNLDKRLSNLTMLFEGIISNFLTYGSFKNLKKLPKSQVCKYSMKI